MFYGITDITTYILGSIFIVLLPGPNSLYIMAVASRYGVGVGYRGACGIFSGDTILMVLSATGAASLLHTMPSIFMLMKYVGAAYLAWIGFGLMRQAFAKWRGAANNASEQVVADTSRPFRTALIISLMNPKAILFFVSFFIQFVDPSYARPALSFTILGLIVQVISAIYLSILIFAGAHLAQQFSRHSRFAALSTGGIGGLFVCLGIKLANSSLA